MKRQASQVSASGRFDGKVDMASHT